MGALQDVKNQGDLGDVTTMTDWALLAVDKGISAMIAALMDDAAWGMPVPENHPLAKVLGAHTTSRETVEKLTQSLFTARAERARRAKEQNEENARKADNELRARVIAGLRQHAENHDKMDPLTDEDLECAKFLRDQAEKIERGVMHWREARNHPNAAPAQGLQQLVN
jgi:hypothetical protein